MDILDSSSVAKYTLKIFQKDNFIEQIWQSRLAEKRAADRTTGRERFLSELVCCRGLE